MLCVFEYSISPVFKRFIVESGSVVPTVMCLELCLCFVNMRQNIAVVRLNPMVGGPGLPSKIIEQQQQQQQLQ